MPFKCEQTNTCDNLKTLFYSKIWNKSRNENSMHAKLSWNVLEDVLVNTNMHHNNGEIWQIWAQVGGKGYILGYVCLTCQFDIPWIFLFLENQSFFSLELKGSHYIGSQYIIQFHLYRFRSFLNYRFRKFRFVYLCDSSWFVFELVWPTGRNETHNWIIFVALFHCLC